MPLLWVKMHIGLLDNDAFRRLGADARLTFLVTIMLAGKQNQDGRLEIRDVGPMTVDEIAFYTSLPVKRQKPALDELVRAHFLTIDGKTYIVERFKEKSDPSDRTAAERQRRRRDILKRHDSVTRDGHDSVTPLRHALEEEVDKEKEKEGESARVTATVTDDAAKDFGVWFHDAAVTSDVLQPVLDPALWAHRQRHDAKVLLEQYGPQIAADKALAFIRAVKLGKIRQAATVTNLLKCADYRELTPMRAVGSDLQSYFEANPVEANA